MRLIIENLNEDVIRQMTLAARQHHRTPEEEAAVILNERFSRAAMVARLKALQAQMLVERGGVLFSDSAEIIRESREHDH